MGNLADRLKVYAEKKSTNNKRNTLHSNEAVKRRKRLYARLADCLLAEVRWQNMANEKWEASYRLEAAAIRRSLHRKPKARGERDDLRSMLLKPSRELPVVITQAVEVQESVAA